MSFWKKFAAGESSGRRHKRKMAELMNWNLVAHDTLMFVS